MASLIRITSKERSPLLFKKSDPENVRESYQAAYTPNSQLPNISHVDTTSLLNLFDRFKGLEYSPDGDDKPFNHLMRGTTSAKDFAWPVASGVATTASLHYQTSPTTTITPSTSWSDTNMANVVRNDSTGSSSYSNRSDATPPMTRHSSSSSVFPAVSPLAQGKVKSSSEAITALPALPNAISNTPSTSHSRTPGRSSTWDPSVSSTHRRPYLDKPLPVGPLEADTKYSNSSARRMHRRGESVDSAIVSRVSKTAVESPTRFESLRKQSRSTSTSVLVSDQTVSGLAASSTGASRGERLGKAVAHANTGVHLRSKSESFPPTIDINGVHARKSIVPVEGSARARKRQVLHRFAKQAITARTAEQVIYRIMCQLDTPKDLQAAAMVSKGFLNTYQRNETRLVSHMIFRSSRPAWELRRCLITLKGSRTFKMSEYQRDWRTISALKVFIAARCQTFCKAKTLAGLLGQDERCQREVENALWRIWTFCALFGDNAAQIPIPTAELDWLNGTRGAKSHALGAGFAVANGDGLTVDELEDMSEMWCCLQVLVSQFHGRQADAARAGVLDNWHLNEGASAHQHIVEWTAYILSMGPQVILSLSSGSFDQAKILGLTRWTAPSRGQTRSGFLMTAISQVYQERLLADATAKAALITLPPKHRPSKSMPDASQLISLSPSFQQSRQPSLRIDTQSLQTRVSKRRPASTSAAYQAPATAIDLRPDCDLAGNSISFNGQSRLAHTRSVSTSAVTTTTTTTTFFPASPTADPTIYHSLNLTAPANTASVKLGATLFPMEYTPTTPRIPFLTSPPPPNRAPPPPPNRAPPPPPPTPPPSVPRVRDPIDIAQDLLINELGFKEANVKRALAMCDTGSGINVERAIELLAIESRREAMAAAAPIELPTPTDIVSPLSRAISRRTGSVRDYCDGGCRRATTSSGNSFASVRTSIVRSATGSIANHMHLRNKSAGNRNQLDTADAEEHETGNISPITDIYGGHSDEETIDDDSSEMWRRREGNDTISPLLSATANFQNVSRMSSQSLGPGPHRKAWKVLGVATQEQTLDPSLRSPSGTLKSGLARMRSKSSASSGVVGLEEYALRVERKRSMRMVQGGAKKGGAVSSALGEQLKGLGLGVGVEHVRINGGLGGLRILETEIPAPPTRAIVPDARDGTKRKDKERWGLKRGATKKDVGGCIPTSPC